MEKQLTKAAFTEFLKTVYVHENQSCYDGTRAIKATRYFSLKENLKAEKPNEKHFENLLEPLSCLFHFVEMNGASTEIKIQAAFIHGFLLGKQSNILHINNLVIEVARLLEQFEGLILEHIESEKQDKKERDDFIAALQLH